MAMSCTDQEIRQNVVDAVQHDTRIDATNVAVDVGNGVVTLAGTVPTYFEKMTADQDARRIKGVLRVQNNLAVNLVQPITDQEIANIVRGNLRRDVRITDPDRIDVTVMGGVVGLTGAVPNYGQKEAATADAWNAAGIRDVVDSLGIVPPTPRSDAEVQADVHQALARDPRVDATRIGVIVTNATVMLNGTVPACYQVEQATHDAWRVTGVANVVNNLSVSS